MKRLICILSVLAIVFTSCDERDEAMLEQMKLANKVGIAFYPDPEAENYDPSTLDYKVTEGDKTLRQIRSFVGGNSEAFKCGYTGNIVFWKDDQRVFSMDFNATKECAHFRYQIAGETRFAEMRPEAIIYFEKLYLLQ